MLKNSIFLVIFLSIVACDNQMSTKEKTQYTQKGKEIAQATFKALSTQLMQQMKLGGPQQAVPFCKVQAMPLTQKLSDTFEVTIKRTSDKLRNQKNKPTQRETEIIEAYKQQQKEKSNWSPIVEIDNDGKKHFYAPIVIKDKCLACHGAVGTQVDENTYAMLKKLYPKDQAINYNKGDIRGIWSIQFKN